MIINEANRRKWDHILMGSVFLLFVIISTYKLTNASLWYDETVEYWYSKIAIGTLPYETNSDRTVNMYQRIISTFQPPLYNVLMHLWLKISDSVWWFRFFGVVMGFIGMIGLYKSVYAATNNLELALYSVGVATFVYQLLYYWQECAEYCLMLCSLFWTIYYWILVIKQPNRKNIINFTISAIVPIYSQYGSAFPVIAMILSATIVICMTKEKKHIIEMLVAYSLAAIFAALPLYVFFLRKQMSAQSENNVTFSEIIFDGGIIKDQIQNLIKIFKWNLLSYYSDTSVRVIFVAIIIMLIIILFKGSKVARVMILVNTIAWEWYYIAVKIGIYSYGDFGNRYNVFFIPMWIVSFFVIIHEVYCFLSIGKKSSKLDLQYIFAGAMVTFCLCFCLQSWNARIQNNWTKEEARNVTEEWIKRGCKDSKTLVYYGANSGFSYYIRSDKRFNKSWENNVTYMPRFRSKSEEQWRDYLNEVYGNNWPEQLYVIATHVHRDELYILSKQLMDKGYKRTDLYNTEGFLCNFFK